MIDTIQLYEIKCCAETQLASVYTFPYEHDTEQVLVSDARMETTETI